jgi:hypothetical protein
MKLKWILPLIFISVVCNAQTMRRNFEYPAVGATISVGGLTDDSVLIADIADGDWGDFSISTNSATLDTGVVGDNEIDYSAVTLTDFDYQTAWRIFYSDTNGDVTELAFGADGTYLQSNGVAAAPTFETALEAPIPDGGGPGLGSGKGGIKLRDLATDIVEIENALIEIQQQVDDFAIVNTTIIGTLNIFGDDDTASADEIAFSLVTTATSTWTDGDEDSRAELSVLNNGVMNNDQLVLATDGSVTTSGLFIPTDLEIPQASPAVPAVDGGVEIDFTDGTLVVQHGSAHAELASATDIVIGRPFKTIDAEQYPHGIVITAITLQTSASSTYAINVENWSDPVTIDASNPTIDAITTSAGTEVTEDTITYSTIAAGQIIMLDLPATDIGWFTITIFYYEPAA